MTKVFEVITETYPKDTTEVIEQRQYVTSEDDNLLDVAEYFKMHCEQFEEELKSVREVLVIVHHIKKGDV